MEEEKQGPPLTEMKKDKVQRRYIIYEDGDGEVIKFLPEKKNENVQRRNIVEDDDDDSEVIQFMPEKKKEKEKTKKQKTTKEHSYRAAD